MADEDWEDSIKPGIAVVIWFGISIAMIVMGAVYKDDCPNQPYIPMYLIVAGVTRVLIFGLTPMKFFYKKVTYIIQNALGLFAIGWLITGCIWVFPIFNAFTNNCGIAVYLFTFSILIIELFFFTLMALGLIVILYKVYAEAMRNRSDGVEIPS
ncbi:transmembrane protein 272 [Bombina bombina]|uniref:transmembrane protein 272 n=1 Tax=Bombina bombina TaxID=8345 RepID=UPI00235ADEEB|nr:transmembrane protein 272 [Bombina bombina]